MIKKDNGSADEILKDPKKMQEDLAEFEKELEDELTPIDERVILGVKPAPERRLREPREEMPQVPEEIFSPTPSAEAAPPSLAPIEDHALPVEDHALPIEDRVSPSEPKLSEAHAPAAPSLALPLAAEPAAPPRPCELASEETPPAPEVVPPSGALSPAPLEAETTVAAPPPPPPLAEEEEVPEEPLEELVSPEDLEIDKAFKELLEQYLPGVSELEVGAIIQVPVVEVKADYVLVDVGDKAEGIIDINEFVDDEGEINISVGDVVDVLVEARDEETGQVIVSHSLAEQKLSIERLRKAHEEKTPVRGIVSQVVRGGLIAKCGSVPCFLPASQVDVVRIDDLSQFLKREVDAYVLDFDLARNRIILSRRKLLQERAEERRAKFLQSIAVGDLIAGRVKNVLDFGAFVDLGPLDGFIPRDEVSWDRGVPPSRYLREGRTAKYRIIAVNREEGKITLSRKQARANPWDAIDKRYPRSAVVRGIVASLTNYGAFVRLEEGITGMIHASDLSWSKGMKRPADYLKEGDNIKAVVLDVDKEKRRLSLGLKQITADPWDEVEKKYPVGARVKGRVTYVTKYGVFVRLDEDLEGMVHISDLSWEKPARASGHVPKPLKPARTGGLAKPGEDVDVVILETNREKRRISLGIKQLSQSPFERFLAKHQTGSFVRGTVTGVTSFGAFIDLGDGVEGLIHVSQLSDERVNDPREVIKVGERVECKIIKLDTENEKISLSRKEYLREIERREVASYVSRSDKGGTNIGELLRKLDIPKDSLAGESLPEHKTE
jgi:small subunit ribosomal protein S1